MKKIFFAAIMLAAAYTLYAQDPTVENAKMKDDKTKVKYDNNTMPMTIRTNFEASFPGVVVMTWEPMNDFWYAAYKNENNRLIHVYYNTQPWYLMRNEYFSEALPILNTFIPEAVISSAIDKYGNDLYSITAMKQIAGAEGVYQVVLIKNGISDRVMMNGGGVVLADVNKT